MKRYPWLIALAVVALPGTSQAQLEEVRQTIFGMD